MKLEADAREIDVLRAELAAERALNLELAVYCAVHREHLGLTEQAPGYQRALRVVDSIKDDLLAELRRTIRGRTWEEQALAAAELDNERIVMRVGRSLQSFMTSPKERSDQRRESAFAKHAKRNLR